MTEREEMESRRIRSGRVEWWREGVKVQGNRWESEKKEQSDVNWHTPRLSAQSAE